MKRNILLTGAPAIAYLLLASAVVTAEQRPESEGPADRAATEADLALLAKWNVEPTTKSIEAHLQSLLKEDPQRKQTLDKLFQQLGGPTFLERDEATKKIAALPEPPLDRLQQAAKSPNADTALRARHLLKRFARKSDPRLAVFRVISACSIPVDLALLLDVVTEVRGELQVAAIELFADRAGKQHVKLVEACLGDDRTIVRVVAIRGLPGIRDDKEALVKELREWLDDKVPEIRIAAARALVDSGATLDLDKLVELLDAATLAIVFRAEEQRFRAAHKDQRGDRKKMGKYQELLVRYGDTLAKVEGVERKKSKRSGDGHWMKLGLDTSKHPELLMYRIRWSNGRWSGWFVPGFNDREQGKGRAIRYWSCFNDHEHEVIRTSRNELHRKVDDLP